MESNVSMAILKNARNNIYLQFFFVNGSGFLKFGGSGYNQSGSTSLHTSQFLANKGLFQQYIISNIVGTKMSVQIINLEF